MNTSDFSDQEVMNDLAGIVLKRLDTPRAKSEDPIPPLLCEVDGTNKSGKNTTIVEVDRWFNRRGFNVRLQEESAEIPWVRATPQQDTYTYQMSHFVHEFTNFLQATGDRHAHLFLGNRNFIDNLYWMESHFRLGKITQKERDEFKSFILGGPWMEKIDALTFLVTDPKTALEREYANTKDVIYGAKMNPERLELLYECTQNVIEELTSKYPELPIIRIDTAEQSIPKVRDNVVSFILRSAVRRLHLTDNDILPWSVALLRRKTMFAGMEIKMRGMRDHSTLHDCGWQFEAAVTQRDTYLLPPNKTANDKEYFRIRETGERWCHYGYKRNEPVSNRRLRFNIPLAPERIGEFLREMQTVAVIEKDREVFIKDGILLHRDKVAGLGEFTEFYGTETMQEAELLKQAYALGFSDSDMVRTSYLALYLERAKSK
ncbi:MAG: CYTH domain-containing protein [Candidatus Sungbacteria bacterium]|nr:CYTH domain-containing protein [Candidatus Sungbacteria bacterium]